MCETFRPLKAAITERPQGKSLHLERAGVPSDGQGNESTPKPDALVSVVVYGFCPVHVAERLGRD
jgi:hypothetical protein